MMVGSVWWYLTDGHWWPISVDSVDIQRFKKVSGGWTWIIVAGDDRYVLITMSTLWLRDTIKWLHIPSGNHTFLAMMAVQDQPIWDADFPAAMYKSTKPSTMLNDSLLCRAPSAIARKRWTIPLLCIRVRWIYTCLYTCIHKLWYVNGRVPIFEKYSNLSTPSV